MRRSVSGEPAVMPHSGPARMQEGGHAGGRAPRSWPCAPSRLGTRARLSRLGTRARLSRLGTRGAPKQAGDPGSHLSRLGTRARRAAGRHGGGPGPGGAGGRGRARARGGRVRGGHGRVQRAGARALSAPTLALPYLPRWAMVDAQGFPAGATEAMQLCCDRARHLLSARTCCPHALTCPHLPTPASPRLPARTRPPQLPAACEGQLRAGEALLGGLLSGLVPGAQVFSGSSPGAARFGHLRLRRSAVSPRPASDASLSSMASL